MSSQTRQKVLLELLKREHEWVSGNEIAASLDVTRETVWKNIKLLQKQGHQIQSQKNLGYQYQGSAQLDSTIANFYKDPAVDHIDVEEQVDSTQMYAKNYLATHVVSNPFGVVSELQTKGYGRRGRVFYSPQAQGLYFSVVMPKPKFESNQIGLITTGVALVVAQQLEKFFPERAFELKWVNDIYMNGRKVAGIITEAITELEFGGTQALIIGIGINLTTTDFPAELKDKATAIQPMGTINRNQLVTELIGAVVNNWFNYLDGSLLEGYRQKSMVLGQKLFLQAGNQTIAGTAVDINELGNIVLKLDDGKLQTFNNGEITKVNLKR